MAVGGLTGKRDKGSLTGSGTGQSSIPREGPLRPERSGGSRFEIPS
ncbi:hypothetical protein CCC_04063 [Paramagnetospirillum magnetotacticum MS-1]|uniref:Uncharacterized protein n=1 Tax=Paramagnetospirillum magnetotacticum MS-1 TaxID=272627 RepID=A0A0C2UDH2_PARME|nr:hypothetical protein CCC_04063 [Paramagnetospirillum magnetotacticum MS-1]